MSLKPWMALLVMAVLFFWANGAHSRLVRLRQGLGQAGGRLAEAMTQRNAAHQRLHAAVQGPLEAERAALQTMAEAQRKDEVSLRAFAAHPLDAERASEWLAAQPQLDASAARVMALLEQHPGSLADDAVARPLADWKEAHARLGLLRQMFNEAAADHDRALLQVPTRWLARLFRFRCAGRV